MTVGIDLWLQRPVPCAVPQQRLVCFPHAGGSASFFRDWGSHLPGADVRAVCYPGRAERITQPCSQDLRELAKDIAEALVPLADLPLFLFGHSMGAAVALQTARCLEAAGVQPAHLFASGSRNACYPPPESDASSDEPDDDPAVIASLLTLGGTSPELAEDPEFQELVLPYIRSDSRMFHGYSSRNGPPLNCPVTTIVGESDLDADRRPWRKLTTGPFVERVVPGDHFYLVARPPYDLLQSTMTLA